MQPLPPLPDDFLAKVAKDYQLADEELLWVFVECFSKNAQKDLGYIADIVMNMSRAGLSARLKKIYDKFSKEVTFTSGPRKRVELHQFLLEQYQMEQYQKSQGSTISDPPDTGKDIDTLVQQAREIVRAKIQSDCGILKVLEMTQPIGLEDIYTPIKILKTITEYRRKPIAESLQDCNFGEGKPEPGLEAIKTYPELKLIIWGKPGSGKTTFLQHLAIQCLEDKFFENRIPIFITLRNFAEEANQPSLLDYILERHNCVTLREILTSGKALVLLDGLDEVREKDSHRVREEIGKFCDDTQFRDNHLVITCRIAAPQYKKSRFKKFTEVEIADFEPAQISDFANKWFKNIDGGSQNFIYKLDNNPRIKELATNPLLLTLLCLVFEKLKDFPANRSKLYKECVDLLLEQWDDEREINRGPVYKNRLLQRKKDLLSQIALTTFEAVDSKFKQKEVERYITNYIYNLPGANTDEEVLQLDSKAVLRSIAAQHGLVIQLDKETYSFSHRTFYEYFTAREIIINQQSSEEALQKLVSHLTDRQWREVFLLAAGISSDADRLLLLMKHKADHLIEDYEKLKQIQNWINNHRLGYQWDYGDRLLLIQSFSNCVDNIPHSATFFGNPTKKFLIISSSQNMILLKFSQTLNEDIVFNFFKHLIKSGILKTSKGLLGCVQTEGILSSWQSWSKKMEINSILKFIEFINVNEYNINSFEEAQLLEWYCDANELLLDCLNSDCRVSQEVKEEIKETLILPIAEIEKRKAEKPQSQ